MIPQPFAARNLATQLTYPERPSVYCLRSTRASACIVLVASAQSKVARALFIHNDSREASVNPKTDEISKKAKESGQIGQKNLENRDKKGNEYLRLPNAG